MNGARNTGLLVAVTCCATLQATAQVTCPDGLARTAARGVTAASAIADGDGPLRWTESLAATVGPDLGLSDGTAPPTGSAPEGPTAGDQEMAQKYYRLAVRTFASGRMDQALDAYRKALWADFDFAWARFGVARIMAMSSRPLEAMIELSRLTTSADPEAVVALEAAVRSPDFAPLRENASSAGAFRLLTAEVRAAAPLDAPTFAQYLMRFRASPGRIAQAVADRGSYRSARFTGAEIGDAPLVRKAALLPAGAARDHVASLLPSLIGCVALGDVEYTALANWREQSRADRGGVELASCLTEEGARTYFAFRHVGSGHLELFADATFDVASASNLEAAHLLSFLHDATLGGSRVCAGTASAQ